MDPSQNYKTKSGEVKSGKEAKEAV